MSQIHPVLSVILNKLIDIVDRSPIEDRSRDVQFRFNKKNVREFFQIPTSDARELAWLSIKEAEQKSLIRITAVGKQKYGVAPYEQQWSIRLIPNKEVEIRGILNRPTLSSTYASRWQETMLALEGEDMAPLSRCPIEIDNRSLDDVVDRVKVLLALKGNLFSREASAKVFWGSSKILDTDARLNAVNVARGNGRQISHPPILLNARVPEEKMPQSVLFIENESTYHRACFKHEQIDNGRTVLVWSTGFKGSSRRIRDLDSLALHYNAYGNQEAMNWFEERLSDGQAPFYFFGDLDLSGLGILKTMRLCYPQMTAWKIGYEFLLKELKRGNAHTPDETGKKRQRDEGATGCQYADDILRPALQESGLFVDQEAFTFQLKNETALDSHSEHSTDRTGV